MGFFRFDTEKDSVLNVEKVVRPAWSGDVKKLTTFYLPSYIDSNDYVNIYKESDSNTLATPQFSIAYGHVTGAGSVSATGDGTPSNKLIYGQIRSLLLQTESGSFSFDGSPNSSPDVIVISLARSRFREKIREGSIELQLKNGGSTLTLTDYPTGGSYYAGTNRYYNLVSGSNGVLANGATINNTSAGSYGWVFPQRGIIVLNPSALAQSTGNKGIGLSIVSSGASRSNNTCLRLFDLMKTGYFSAMGEEKVTSRIFQATVNMDECNYTTNPTIINDKGELIYQSFVDNPETFITTIGIYDDLGDLLAVAKLSKPVRKNSVTKPTFQIKMSW